MADVTDFLAGAIVEETKEVKKEEPKKEEAKEVKKEEPKKGKEDQISDLRKAKDDAERKVKEYEDKLKEYDSLKKLSAIKPIAEYIEKKEGKLDEESVNSFITRQRDRKGALKKSEETIKEKEARLKEISLIESDDWKENYQKPINDANDALIATVANFDKDKKIKNPKHVDALIKTLLVVDEKTGEPLSAKEMKPILLQFAEEYEKSTGEEYDLPSIKEVVDSVRSVVSKFKAAYEAKADWDKTSETSKKEKVFKAAQEERKRVEKEIESRDYVVNKYIEGFDYSKLDGVISKEDYIAEVKAQHGYFIDAAKDPAKRNREYHDFVELSSKGKLFDRISQELIDTKKALEAEKEKVKSGLPNGNPAKTAVKTAAKTGNEDPTAFLN